MVKVFTKFVFMSLFLCAFLNINELWAGSPPQPVYPLSNAQCVSTDLTFDWDISPNAVKYHIQIANDAGFTDIVKWDSTTNTEYAYKLHENNKVYFWRAGSKYAGDDQIYFTEAMNFTTTEAGPQLVFPENAATCVSNKLTIRWSKVGFQTFDVQLSKSPTFASIESQRVSVNQDTMNVILNSNFTDYYYRVKGHKQNCSSDWSEAFKFTSGLSVPNAVSPINKAKGVEFDLQLEWQNVDGAENYDLQMAYNPNFTGTLLADLQSFGGNTHNMTLDTFNSTIYWRIRAKSASCSSEWGVYSFKTVYRAPELVSPAANDSCVSLNSLFKWKPVTGVYKYSLQVATTQFFEIMNTEVIIDSIVGTQQLAQLPSSMKNYWFRVRGDDSSNQGRWSTPQKFTSTNFAPSMDLPEDKVTKVPLTTTLSWDNLTSISSFSLQVAKDSTFKSIYYTVTTSEKSKEVTLDEYNKTYYWRVAGNLGKCSSDWTEFRRFTTIVGSPDLIAPVNKAKDQPVFLSFEWSEVSTAKSYDVQFSTTSDFSVLEIQTRAGLVATKYSTNFKALTTYYWRARSNDQWGQSPWSETFEFTTGIAKAGVPEPQAPENRATKLDLATTLSWTAIENSENYVLQISEDSDFNTIFLKVDTITQNSFTTYNLSNFKTYYWQVATKNKMGQSDFSTAWRFRTIAAEITDKQELLSPANEEINVPFKVLQLNWSDIPATKEEGAYNVQVSENADFSDFAFTNPKVYTNTVKVYNLKANTKHYWRVAPMNEFGQAAWSDVYSFTTENETSVEDSYVVNFMAQLAPNPVSSNAQLSFNLDEVANEVKVSIVDMFSNVVYERRLSYLNAGEHHLDLMLNNLSNASYFVKIQAADKYQIIPLIKLK